jgi:peroxiredoxin
MSSGRIEVDEKARDFTLLDTEGRSVTLSDFEGKENVYLVFNRGFA